MIAVFIILGFVATGILIGLFATATAPVGFEDESGFHYGPEQEQVHEEFASAVSRPHLA
ncbi:MAG: hypothetical protein ACTHLW_04160 [Verrucomicrobiota bacterium]